MKVAIYGMTESGLKGARSERGDRIGNCLADGFKVHGIDYSLHSRFDGVCADVALAYGWIHELRDKLFTAYKEAGKHFVFFDLGYWNRGHKGAYRVSVDDWDSARNMLRGCPDDRFRGSRITFRSDWNSNSKQVTIVGMSDKAAWTHGYKYMEWEEATKRYLQNKYEGMGFNFVIRHKPRGKEAKKAEPISEVLRNTYYVVSHHSNVGVDAIIAGIPYTCRKGVAMHLAPITNPDDFVRDLHLLRPFIPSFEQKYNLMCDIAYVQWTTAEMSKGLCWDYITKVLEKCA